MVVFYKVEHSSNRMWEYWEEVVWALIPKQVIFGHKQPISLFTRFLYIPVYQCWETWKCQQKMFFANYWFIYMCVCIYIDVYIHICVYVYTYMYIYTRICAHIDFNSNFFQLMKPLKRKYVSLRLGGSELSLYFEKDGISCLLLVETWLYLQITSKQDNIVENNYKLLLKVKIVLWLI